MRSVTPVTSVPLNLAAVAKWLWYYFFKSQRLWNFEPNGALWKFWPITKSRTYFKTRRNQSICIWWLPKYLGCHFWTVWARSFVESSLHPPFPDASNARYTDILSPFNLASHSPHCEHFEFVDHFRELYYFQLAVCGAPKVNLGKSGDFTVWCPGITAVFQWNRLKFSGKLLLINIKASTARFSHFRVNFPSNTYCKLTTKQLH